MRRHSSQTSARKPPRRRRPWASAAKATLYRATLIYISADKYHVSIGMMADVFMFRIHVCVCVCAGLRIVPTNDFNRISFSVQCSGSGLPRPMQPCIDQRDATTSITHCRRQRLKARMTLHTFFLSPVSTPPRRVSKPHHIFHMGSILMSIADEILLMKCMLFLLCGLHD